MSFVKLDPRSRKHMVFEQFIPNAFRSGIRKGFIASGKELVREANRSILDKPKNGRLYILRRNGRTVRHRASAAGESPANFTGKLRKSIAYKVSGSSEMVFGANTPYAPALELGSPSRNLQARPYLIDAIKKQRKNTRNYFERSIGKNLARGAR